MYSMRVDWVVFLVLLATTNSNLVQSIRRISPAEEMELETQLKLINKPAIKSFKNEYGDTFDCIEIDKQLAFDHPLLKNLSIQMKPSGAFPKLGRPSSTLNASQLLLNNNIRCPKGSVVTKRVQKEDLLMAKFSPSFGTMFKYKGSDKLPPGHQLAILVMPEKNVGVHGFLNIWAPQLAADQISSANIFLASPDGSLANGIATGWSMNPYLYPNSSRFFIYWTKDSGKSTGCFNILCPGFVQISRKTPVGALVSPISTYGGTQYELLLNIIQDDMTGNWWVQCEGENVGYYPKEIFTTLGYGAGSGGWGGETFSPVIEAYPPMGSGHFPEEGFGKACYIRDMKLLDPSHAVILPDKNKLLESVSMPRCYRLLYAGLDTGVTGATMYFGGPPNCIWEH